jgi:hypothetical protein
MSHIKTLKSTPTCFDQQLIIIREFICSSLKITELKMWVFIRGDVVMRQHNMFCFYVVSSVVRHADCNPHHTRHHVKTNAAPLTANPPQQHTIPHTVICSLRLLMMDKCLSETCWADLEDQYIFLFVASSWSWFYYIAYIEDARSNTNQIQYNNVWTLKSLHWNFRFATVSDWQIN